jgi:hypothetical protein
VEHDFGHGGKAQRGIDMADRQAGRIRLFGFSLIRVDFRSGV